MKGREAMKCSSVEALGKTEEKQSEGHGENRKSTEEIGYLVGWPRSANCFTLFSPMSLCVPVFGTWCELRNCGANLVQTDANSCYLVRLATLPEIQCLGDRNS